MPILISEEKYNTLGSLYANAGDWIDCECHFSTRFSIGSGTSAPFTYHSTGTQHYISSANYDFGDYGFVAGDTVTISWIMYSSGATSSYSRTIEFVNGGTMFIDSALPSSANGLTFPTDGHVAGMLILADKKPDSIEAEINLALNGTTSTNSVIDGSTNRLEANDLSSLAIGDYVAMSQLGDKSGGYIKNVRLHYVADSTSTPPTVETWRDWKITYKMFQWGVIKDGFAEPNYYDNTECLAPIVKVKAFAQYGNPNGVLEKQSENNEANTGGFNENFNGGANNYALTNITWTDSLGNSISAMDYKNDSNFTATITQAVQSTTLSKYRIGILFRPVDGSVYQNLVTGLGQNLLVNAPEVDFVHATSPDATVYTGSTNSSGARWDLTNLQFTQNSGVLTVTGTVKPNANCEAYFSNFPDGERKTTIWVSLSNHNYVNQFSDKVSLKIFDEDNIDAPIKGVQIPNVVNQYLYDHAVNNIFSNTSPQTTTEDDVLYKSDFRLVDNVNYEGVRARIFAYNTVTEEEFTLENYFFSFANVPYINGQYQPNFTVNRNFNLPPTTDRNTLKLIRKPSLDISGKYGVQFSYGYLNDWRYWLAQGGVNNDFFNITQSHNGQNKDWQHYSNTGNWIIRLSYYTRVNGVEDFNNYEAGIRPYNADASVSTTNTYLVDSLGQNTTSLLNDEVHTLTSVCTWDYNYLNAWAEITIEDYEGGNRWVISSYLAQGGITSNPLKPIAGVDKLDMQIVGNIATLKCKVDTNVVSASDVSISTRIYSEENTGGQIINASDEAELAYSLRRVTNTSVYNGNCIRVRRGSDNTEQDIGFSGDVLDTGALIDFAGNGGTDRAWITIWYDQSGNGNNAVMTNTAFQPLIVNSGAVITASNTKPAVQFNGTTEHLTLTSSVAVGQVFYESFVFERTDAGIDNISLGSSVASNPYSMFWDSSNVMYSGMEESGDNSHASSQTTTGDFLVTTRRELANNNVTMRRNGAGVGIANYTIGSAGSLNTFGMKKASPSSIYNSGNIQELLFFKVDKSASQTFIETNTNNFYNIY